MPTPTFLNASTGNISDSQLSYLLEWFTIAGPVDTSDPITLSNINLIQSGTNYSKISLLNGGNLAGRLDQLDNYWTRSDTRIGLVITEAISMGTEVTLHIENSTVFDDNDGIYKYTIIFSRDNSNDKIGRAHV